MSAIEGHSDDLVAERVWENPHAYFAHLRETDPVHWNPHLGSWMVSRHSDVLRLIRTPENFSSALQEFDPRAVVPAIPESQLDEALALSEELETLVVTDPPEHTAIRQTIHRWFTPRAVEKWRYELGAIARDLIRTHQSDGGMELKRDFATQLPLKTICMMLGIPMADVAQLHALAAARAKSKSESIGRGFDLARARDAEQSRRSLYGYFMPLIEQRAKSPGEDLISMLAEGARRGAMTERQCIDNVILLLIAGHETTLNLISNGVLAFIQNPAQWSLLCSDPEGVCASAVEECLRYEPSFPILYRVCTRDTELGDRVIHAGDRVNWIAAAANRDPRVFDEPDQFDINRCPNPHVSFGGGIHHCLGAALTRIEAQEAFKALAHETPKLRLATDRTEYEPQIMLRALRSLPVTWN